MGGLGGSRGGYCDCYWQMGDLSCPFIWLSRINLCPTLHAVGHTVRTVAKADPWTTPLVTGEANLASTVTAEKSWRQMEPFFERGQILGR